LEYGGRLELELMASLLLAFDAPRCGAGNWGTAIAKVIGLNTKKAFFFQVRHTRPARASSSAHDRRTRSWTRARRQ